MSEEYEEGMEKQEDIMIHGICERCGRVEAFPKHYLGEKEPHWICPKCGIDLKDITFTKIAFPCSICGFFEAEDIGGGNWICGRCLRTWKQVSLIMSVAMRESSDAET